MVIFLKNVISFIVIGIILLAVVNVINYSFFINKNRFVLPSNTKRLILGNSHAECALNDELIDNSMNLANSAESYFYTYYKLKKILENNSQVDTIFLEFNTGAFNRHSETWDTIPSKYARYSEVVDFSGIKNLFLKYTLATINIIIKSSMSNFFTKNRKIIDGYWGGYLYLKRDKLSESIERYKNDKNFNKVEGDFPEYISKFHIEYLKKIIKLCEENNVEIFLIRSPIFYLVDDDNKKQIYFIKNKYFNEVKLLDFANFPLDNDQYGDTDHLNYRGARKFSVFFNNLLKNGLLTKNNKQMYINSKMESMEK